MDFWEWKSDRQQGLVNEEESIDYYISKVSPVILDIFNLAERKIGTFSEIAYEWSWEEVQDILEIIDLREEMQRRDSIKRRAEVI